MKNFRLFSPKKKKSLYLLRIRWNLKVPCILHEAQMIYMRILYPFTVQFIKNKGTYKNQSNLKGIKSIEILEQKTQLHRDHSDASVMQSSHQGSPLNLDGDSFGYMLFFCFVFKTSSSKYSFQTINTHIMYYSFRKVLCLLSVCCLNTVARTAQKGTAFTRRKQHTAFPPRKTWESQFGSYPLALPMVSELFTCMGVDTDSSKRNQGTNTCFCKVARATALPVLWCWHPNRSPS